MLETLDKNRNLKMVPYLVTDFQIGDEKLQTDFYKKYMRSKEWEEKRQQRLEIDNHKCAMCDRPESKCKDGLQIHHISYRHLGDEDVFTDNRRRTA